MASPLALLLAHQGGWDEILMVAGPLAVIGGLLVLANRRAKRALADQLEAEDPPDSKPDRSGASTTPPTPPR